MIYNLNQIYKKFYQDKMSELQFIKYFQRIFNSKNTEIIFNSDIFNYWTELNFSTVPLYLYAMLEDISSKKFAKINLKLSKIV